jgi:ligand-binding sensor domain-containing protein/signal transduction histidine kinase
LIDRRRGADAMGAWLLVLLCVLTAGVQVSADARASTSPYVWRSWTRLDGLPGSQVWAITQDHTGYIWLGTNEGLVRFDGVRFVSGRQLGFDRLPNASVRALFVARDGGLWIGFGTGGISRLKDGRLQTFTADDGLPPGVVAGIVEDRRGSIWTASADGLYRFENGRWDRVSLATGATPRAVNAVHADLDGRLWVGTRAGVYRSASGAPTQFERVTTVFAQSLAGDKSGNVWSVGDGALTLLSASPPRTIGEAAAYAPGRRIVADRQGRLWIATLGDGLLRVSPGSHTVVDQLGRPGVPSYDDVLAVFEDREGNIWVGTPRGLDRGSQGLIRSLPGVDDGITAPVQAVAAAADGSVWVGTTNGLHRFAQGVRGTLIDSAKLPSRGVVALHGDAKGRMWVATARGIGRIDSARADSAPRGAHFVPLIPVGTLLNRPVAMTTDRDGTLWLCDLERGLFTWDGTTLVAVPAAQYGNRAAFSILADSAGRIWAGHLDGTISVHEAGRARLYGTADGVLGSVVTGFYQDRAGSVWAGSRNGLMRFRDGHIDSVARNRGLPGHTVTGITGDSDGNLWIGVSAGVARLRPAAFDSVITGAAPSLAHTLYDGSDGLRGDPFPQTAPAAIRGGDGRLWFLTSDGVAVVSPESHQKSRIAPPVVIETVAADQRPIVPERDHLVPPRTANLRIDYAALSFVAPEKVRFTYLMEGFDADWVDAGARRQAFYTNLPPGDYRFRVRASNDGVASEREAVWAFTLAPAFYQTRWFAAMMVALALTGAALAWRARVQQVRGRFSAILIERTRVAREIHDTLLQSLLGVMFKLDEVSNVIDVSSASAKEQLVRLRHQVEFYVREARYSIRDLRSPTLQSRGLATTMRAIGETLTSDRGVAFDLRVAGTPRGNLQRVDEHLLRIGQEAMTNAVRHGDAAAVSVELTYHSDSVALCVRDDGKGFDAAHMSVADGVHWGLRTMRERAEQIGGALRIDSAKGQGTVVEVVVPIPPSDHS